MLSGMASSADPDQTAPSDCLHMQFCQKLRCMKFQDIHPIRNKTKENKTKRAMISTYVYNRTFTPTVMVYLELFLYFFSYMYGEEGYCLTSFQTAINYLISEGMKAAISENS